MKIKILYDNKSKGSLVSDWGFSALIEGEEKILFDTGAEGDILTSNMEKMSINSSEIDKIALSHEHHDHTGGIFSILESSMKVYVPTTFSREIKKKIEEKAKIEEISGEQQISEGIYTTGVLGEAIKEQSLMIKGEKGDEYFLMTGCAHPNLGAILKEASQHGDIFGVIGGFHGFKDFDALKNISVIVPCHCTKYKDKVKSTFPEETIDCFAGLKIDIKSIGGDRSGYSNR